jgi:tRNA(adenine34) deaminase
MDQALAAATQAAAQGEVPVGAVLVCGPQLFVDHNRTAHGEYPLRHAEMQVLTAATAVLTQAEMRTATLFVTLEPCPMCMGAILHSHLGQLVFAASNLKWGCCGSVFDLRREFPAESLQITGGIREAEAAALLSHFFEKRR